MATSTPQTPYPETPGAAEKKGTSPIVWILVGCGGLMLLLVIGLSVVLYWGAHKVKDYAEAAEKNPAIFAAKLAVAADPDLEIVSEDKDKGSLTIRNKKTGEVLTMLAEDIKQGRLKFRDEKGQEVTLEGKLDENQPQLTLKSDEGTMTFGTASTQPAPPWVPSYPGATPVATLSKTGEDGIYGNYSFQTSDPVDKVLAHFETELKANGFTVEKTNVQGGVVTLGNLHATRDGGQRNVDISTMLVGAIVQVTVQYSTSGGIKD